MRRSRLKQGMKFSIITSTLNAAALLPATAQSLARQTHRDFEWIIVDGASTDDTAATVHSFGGLVSRYVSEPDTGIYEAWNKALGHVTGDWVIFLGAGDALHDEHVLSRANDAVASLPAGATMLYGKVLVVEGIDSERGRVREEVWRGVGEPWSYRSTAVPSHQAVFQRSSTFTEGFRFDERLRICADMELMLRELLASRAERRDFFVTRFVGGGASQKKGNLLRKAYEGYLVHRKLGLLGQRVVYHLVTLAVSALLHPFRRLGDRIRASTANPA